MFHRASCVGGQRLKSTTAFVSCREQWRAMRGKNNEKKCFAITMEFRLQNFLWDIFIAFVSLTRRWKRHENWQRGATRTRMAENFYATENYVAISSKKTQKIGKFLCLKFDHVREGFLAWCRVCVYVSRLSSRLVGVDRAVPHTSLMPKTWMLLIAAWDVVIIYSWVSKHLKFAARCQTCRCSDISRKTRNFPSDPTTITFFTCLWWIIHVSTSMVLRRKASEDKEKYAVADGLHDGRKFVVAVADVRRRKFSHVSLFTSPFFNTKCEQKTKKILDKNKKKLHFTWLSPSPLLPSECP